MRRGGTIKRRAETWFRAVDAPVQVLELIEETELAAQERAEQLRPVNLDLRELAKAVNSRRLV
jgi:hypothetical protein